MRAGLVALAVLLPAGCVSVSGVSAPAAQACVVGKPMVETMLFLGMASPAGPVTPQAFQAFVETEVTPRWQEGYTILEGQGLWYSDQRHITEREPSRVLVRFHDVGATASSDIEAIRKAYIKAFSQDAVLRTDRPACVDF
jgi:hypothetical protein